MTTRLYDGTNTTITHTTGDYIFDNTNATGSSIFRLGTDTSATDFQVQNNSASAVLTVDATGLITLVSHLVLGDSDEIRLGASTDFTIAHDGTSDTIFDNTHVTGSTIFRLGTDTTATDFQVQNNSASAVLTVDATGVVTLTNNLVLADSDEIRVGTGTDFTIVHGGTNTNITSATGDLIVDNTNATGSTIFLLGTDTSATDFQIQNNSATAIMTVLGDSTVRIADNASFTIGTGDDLSMSHNGTNTTITSQTGDLTIDNTNATGSTIFLLGTDTTATDFQIQNNSASALLTVQGSGATTLAGATTFSGATATFNANSTFNTITTFTQDVSFGDSDSLFLGAGNDLSIVHGGTNTNITSATGDLIVDNTNATGSTIFILGTDDTATDFQVQNNSAAAKFTVLGSGATTIASTSLSIGGVSYTWPGSDGSNGNVLTTNGSGTLTWGGVSASFASGSEQSFILNQSEADNTTSGDAFGLYFKRNEVDVIGDTAFTSGTADSGTASTLTDAALTYGNRATLIGSLIKITGGAGNGDVRKITEFNTGTDTITANSNFSATIDATSTYEIYNQIYPAIVYDHNANALAARVYKNENYGASLTGNFAFECGSLKANGAMSTTSTLDVAGLATFSAGSSIPASFSSTFGSGAGDQGTISYASATFTLASTDNTTMTIGDNYTGAENKLLVTLGSITGNTRFEVSDGSATAKFSVNDNGNVSIVDSFYRQATVSTTDATQTDIFTFNCKQMNSIIVEADIIGTNTNGSGYGNLNTQSFKLIASFVKSAAETFTQVGSTDKLSLGSQTWDTSISTSGNYLLVEVTGANSTNISWKSLNKITYILDTNIAV